VSKFDLSRNSQNTALIGDPRNDENLIISQLQVLFLRFHNVMVDAIRQKHPGKSQNLVFTEAQEMVRWHYQWIVLHEFLKLLCTAEVVDDILTKGRKFYGWHNQPYIPVEFSVAAYRYGHRQVRPSYRANFGVTDQPAPTPFIANIFDFNIPNSEDDPEDFRARKRSQRRFIDWHTFWDYADIDSLASRNLLRGLTFSLPSRQRVAHAMRLTPMDSEHFEELKH